MRDKISSRGVSFKGGQRGEDCSAEGGSAPGGKSVARALRRFSEGSAFGGESSPAHFISRLGSIECQI